MKKLVIGLCICLGITSFAYSQEADDSYSGKRVIKEHVPEHRAYTEGKQRAKQKESAKVVIDGTGVRLRYGPSLQSKWLVWENTGYTRSPNKGARLQYVGSDGDWYIVRYLGRNFYVSKEYSHLEY